MNRKYFVKGGWIFNLEAMHDKLWCIQNDIEEGRLHFPLEIAGTLCKDEDDLALLQEEAEKLEWIAKSRKVDSREYGRIKQLVEWRVFQRYMACMVSGMDERIAGQCFEEV